MIKHGFMVSGDRVTDDVLLSMGRAEHYRLATSLSYLGYLITKLAKLQNLVKESVNSKPLGKFTHDENLRLMYRIKAIKTTTDELSAIKEK